MKSAKLLNLLMVSLLLATFATGCKKNPKNITNIPGMRATPPDNGGMNRAINPGGLATPGSGGNRWKRPN